jgi:hypothetical protein
MLIPQAREKHLLFLVEKQTEADPSPACGIGMTIVGIFFIGLLVRNRITSRCNLGRSHPRPNHYTYSCRALQVGL